MISINSANLVLSAIAVLTLLAWGGFAVLFTQTTPGDEASIVSRLVSQPQLQGNTGGNATISPGAEARYVVTFKTNIPANAAPQARDFSNGLGYSFGPAPFDTTNSGVFPRTVSYAVFTFLFGWQAAASGGYVPSVWATGPLGNNSIQPTFMSPGYAGVDSYARQMVASFNQHIGWSTFILEVDTVGNYTLHFQNSGIMNAAGIVTMGYGNVVFSRSTPYVYIGAATIVVAVALGVGISFENWRRGKHTRVS